MKQACAVSLQASLALLFAFQILHSCRQFTRLRGASYCVCVGSYVSVVFLSLLTKFRDPGRFGRYHQASKQRTIFALSEYTQFHCEICRTCNVHKPPLTGHCSLCGDCVVLFDHHCEYLCSDIGIRNYLPFLLLLRAVLLFYTNSLVCIILAIIIEVKHRASRDELPIYAITFSVLLAYYALVGCYFGVNMIDYHRFLVSNGDTTSSYLKDKGTILWNFEHALLQANEYLNEVCKEIVFRKKEPGLWTRAVTGFSMPQICKMDQQEAELTAWRYALAASGLNGHLPENIIARM